MLTIEYLNKVKILHLVGQKFAQFNILYIIHYNNLSKREKRCVRIRGLMAACADVLRNNDFRMHGVI